MTDWCPDLSRSAQAALPRDRRHHRRGHEEPVGWRTAIGCRRNASSPSALSIDFTTVARGYVEAQRRGLIESRVGQGTFVRGAKLSGLARRRSLARGRRSLDEPAARADRPDLVVRMREGLAEVSRDLVSGCCATRASAAARRQGCRLRLARTARPGAQAGADLRDARRACRPSPAILSHAGARGRLRAVRGDHLSRRALDRGPARPRSWSACRWTSRASTPMRSRRPAARLAPKALYLNPTLQNPTTMTVPERRRRRSLAVARRFGLPIVEDDAYGFIPSQRRASDRQPSRPTSPGTSPASPNASAPDFAPPMSWPPTRAPVGRSRRRCGPPT